MKKLFKRNVKFIMGLIMGMVCSSITVYASYQYMAKEVSYTPRDITWKVKNVEEALDDLYNEYYKEKEKGYGIRRKLNTINSSWERVGASNGLEATAQIGNNPVKNDFDNIYPWSDIISYNYNTETKQITAYYGDSNFKFDGSNGEVLTRIPEFYYQRYQDGEYEYIYISKDSKEGYTKSEEFSVGRYTMSGDATKVHSRSGYHPLTNTTITEYRNYAQMLGNEFGQLDYHYFILQLLYLVEYADYNSQTKLGLGYTNSSNTGPIRSGNCDILGMKSGSIDGTDTTSIIYRGIEDIFGNITQFIDGINVKDHQVYICYDQNQYEVDKYDGCYQRIGYMNASVNGYPSQLGFDLYHPLVSFPIKVEEKYGNKITDHYVQNIGNRIVAVGGRFTNGTGAGLWYWYIGNASSARSINNSARLIKKN